MDEQVRGKCDESRAGIVVAGKAIDYADIAITLKDIFVYQMDGRSGKSGC